SVSNDRWVWSIDSSGEFSVKSTRLYIDDYLLPALPTRLNLSLRGIEIPTISCPICSSVGESCSHLLFSCNMARILINKVAHWWELDILNLLSYEEWLDWFKVLRLPKGIKDILEVQIVRERIPSSFPRHVFPGDMSPRKSPHGHVAGDRGILSPWIELPGVDPNDPSVNGQLASMQNQPEVIFCMLMRGQRELVELIPTSNLQKMVGDGGKVVEAVEIGECSDCKDNNIESICALSGKSAFPPPVPLLSITQNQRHQFLFISQSRSQSQRSIHQRMRDNRLGESNVFMTSIVGAEIGMYPGAAAFVGNIKGLFGFAFCNWLLPHEVTLMSLQCLHEQILLSVTLTTKG
ncbi:RNA-directed DNA polymerase, eukaryota, partial [Tanacetum coccineum]